MRKEEEYFQPTWLSPPLLDKSFWGFGFLSTGSMMTVMMMMIMMMAMILIMVMMLGMMVMICNSDHSTA